MAFRNAAPQACEGPFRPLVAACGQLEVGTTREESLTHFSPERRLPRHRVSLSFRYRGAPVRYQARRIRGRIPQGRSRTMSPLLQRMSFPWKLGGWSLDPTHSDNWDRRRQPLAEWRAEPSRLCLPVAPQGCPETNRNVASPLYCMNSTEGQVTKTMSERRLQ